MSSNKKPSIVFAHGFWADGSCFSKVIKLLQADGHETIAAQIPLDAVEGDVAGDAAGRLVQPAGSRGRVEDQTDLLYRRG